MGHHAPRSVVVGLSSGVDSSVAAWLLKEEGFNVIGVTLALSDDGSELATRSCSATTLTTKSRAIAEFLGIPHHVVDSRREFGAQVVDYFVSEYESGRTPNPCAKCNARVRFHMLQTVAEHLGAGTVATGHYARLLGEPPRLSRAKDRAKDQSYMLAEVEPGLLERCVFPLGDLEKGQVRQIAADVGLSRFVSNESQEICFIPDNRYRDFLRHRLGERPGRVLDEHGNTIGEHKGTYNFTIGQRKGLSLGGGPPLFVSRVDADRGEVQVTRGLGDGVREIRFVTSAVHREPFPSRVKIQFRSMGEAVDGSVSESECVLLDLPARGVAAGQTIVLYDGEMVVCGGTITSTS